VGVSVCDIRNTHICRTELILQIRIDLITASMTTHIKGMKEDINPYFTLRYIVVALIKLISANKKLSIILLKAIEGIGSR
jgi:hypothetical protein